MKLDYSRISIRYNVELLYDNKVLLDYETALLLKLVMEKGSLLAAARSLGIAYSRAWEKIARAEKTLGAKLVTATRGGASGGGTRVTRVAEELLSIYEKAVRRLETNLGPLQYNRYIAEEPDLIIAYSHDPILEDIVMKRLEGRGYSVEGLCLGSSKALALLSLGEADVATTHLYDPDTSEYNRPYIAKYLITSKPVILGGYMRELVFMFREDIKVNTPREALLKILRGELKLVNRNEGSGTRVYLDYLLEKTSREHGLTLSNIRGYYREAYTHNEVAKTIASGKADIGLGLRYVAEQYGLNYVHATWEKYEYVTTRARISKKPVKELTYILNSEWFRKKVVETPGYMLLEQLQPI